MHVQKVICGVLKGSTRVLVTNQLQILAEADIIVVMGGGRIVAKGTLAQLKEQGVPLSHLLNHHHSGTHAAPPHTCIIMSSQLGAHPIPHVGLCRWYCGCMQT